MAATKPTKELKSKHSLGQMMELLRDLDDDMLPEEFDPQELIGDIRDKVDGIKWKLDDWEYKAKMIEERFITPLKRRMKALQGKREKLKRYVTEEMKRLDVEKIPGNLCRVNLQDSTPSVEIKIEADAQMYLNYPSIVLQETTYKWDKEEIKSLAKAGETFTFAEVKRGKHIKFYTQGETENDSINDATRSLGPAQQEPATIQIGPTEDRGAFGGAIGSSSSDGIQ